MSSLLFCSKKSEDCNATVITKRDSVTTEPFRKMGIMPAVKKENVPPQGVAQRVMAPTDTTKDTRKYVPESDSK
jgi:hypothetical protein